MAAGLTVLAGCGGGATDSSKGLSVDEWTEQTAAQRTRLSDSVDAIAFASGQESFGLLVPACEEMQDAAQDLRLAPPFPDAGVQISLESAMASYFLAGQACAKGTMSGLAQSSQFIQLATESMNSATKAIG